MKECIICKKEFVGRTCLQKCCSKECSAVNRINYEHSDERKESRDLRLRLYEQTDKRKRYRLKYEATEKRKQLKKAYAKTEKRKTYILKWNKNPKRLVWLKMWRKTPAGSRRRSDANNIIEMFSIRQWIQKVEATKGYCPCCYCLFDNWLHLLTKDHIYAISRASNDFIRTGIKRVYTIDDVQPLCKSCNSIKKERTISLDELRELVMKRKYDSKPNTLEVTQTQ